MDKKTNELLMVVAKHFEKEDTVFDLMHVQTCMAEMLWKNNDVYARVFRNNETGTAEFYSIIYHEKNYLCIFIDPSYVKPEGGRIVRMSSRDIILEVLTDKSMSGIFVEVDEDNGYFINCEDFKNIVDLVTREKQRISSLQK